jgi:Glyoxalase-like domain
MIGRLEKTVFDCPDPRALAATDYTPPVYADPEHPQHLHVDIRVDDIEAAQAQVLRLGARRLEGRRETGFRVYTDPAGHPFCLVFGRKTAEGTAAAEGADHAG